VNVTGGIAVDPRRSSPTAAHRRSACGALPLSWRRRWLRHRRDHAPIWQIEACGAAMAGAVHGRGRRRADARQDAQARQKPVPAATVQNVALGPPPGEATHWTGRMLAKVAGVSLRSVQRILEATKSRPAGLEPATKRLWTLDDTLWNAPRQCANPSICC
jgi:hypothetical protein